MDLITDVWTVWTTLLTANIFSFALVAFATIIAPLYLIFDVMRGAFK